MDYSFQLIYDADRAEQSIKSIDKDDLLSCPLLPRYLQVKREKVRHFPSNPLYLHRATWKAIISVLS